MANAYRIKITKAPDWERVADRLDDELELALTNVAIWLGRGSALKAPVDTGRLRKGTRGEYRKEGTKHIAVVGSWGVEYATYVHEGTRKMRARPYIRETLEEKKDYIRRSISRAVRRAWDEPGGTTEGE